MKKFTRKALCSLLVVLMCFASVSIGGFAASAVKVTNGTTYITKADLNSGYIELGSYPQTEVKMDTAEYDALTDAYLKNFDNIEFKSYGYYSGKGSPDSIINGYGYGTMEKNVDMTYADMTVDGTKYRIVLFQQYRPTMTTFESSTKNSNIDDNGYKINRLYFFKYEPLKWRVLDKETGLIMCESIIDSQAINNTAYYVQDGNAIRRYYFYNNAEHTQYLYNYNTSSIRSWLNDDFYNTAFSSADKTAIANYSENDKVSLPDFTVVISEEYGFTNSDEKDSSRMAKGTDYAKCQGLELSNKSATKNYSPWWLSISDSRYYRDSGFGMDYTYNYRPVYIVSPDGNTDSSAYAMNSSIGVRPVLQLNLHTTHDYSYSKRILKSATHTATGRAICYCVCGASQTVTLPKTTKHTYNVTDSTPATCTKPGSKNYLCACGDTYTDTIPATGHTFDGSKCTTCGYDRADDCSCNCHKSGISKFFFNIILLFQKLFGNNRVCDCGKSHY